MRTTASPSRSPLAVPAQDAEPSTVVWISVAAQFVNDVLLCPSGWHTRKHAAMCRAVTVDVIKSQEGNFRFATTGTASTIGIDQIELTSQRRTHVSWALLLVVPSTMLFTPSLHCNGVFDGVLSNPPYKPRFLFGVVIGMALMKPPLTSTIKGTIMLLALFGGHVEPLWHTVYCIFAMANTDGSPTPEAVTPSTAAERQGAEAA